MEYLSNGILELEISPRGAELQSVRRVTCPMEYLWQGDATYWDRRSPVLFPNVGKVWQNTTHVNGQPYTLYQHGFLRDMVFKKIADEDRHLAFTCCADDESRNVYPFDFQVRIDYRLLRNVITVEWTVENRNENTVSGQDMAAGMTPEVTGIEDAFARLNMILSKMDEEGVSLEESFRLYEQGMKLIRYCNETIDTVEKKVRVLSAGGEQDEFSV